MSTLTIGALAKAAGVHVETIRYYQRIGLIREPERPPQGFRHYALDQVERLRFIRRAQGLGFSLKEISGLLELDSGHCADVRARAEQRRASIDAQIRDLAKLRNNLDALIRSCDDGDADRPCPIIETLSGPSSR